MRLKLPRSRWTPLHLGESTCRRDTEPRIHLSSGAAWSSWSEQGARRRAWPRISSRLRPRFGTGSARPTCDAGTRTDGVTTDEREELARLRRENRDATRGARDSKKIRGLVRPGSEPDAAEAFRFVKAHQAVHCVRTMCRLLGFSTSGFYASLDRPLSTRAKRDLVLSAKLEACAQGIARDLRRAASHAELVADGEKVGRKRVARLMRKAGLVDSTENLTTIPGVGDVAAHVDRG